MSGAATLVTAALLRGWPVPESGSDKETHGRLLLLGGSGQTAGAALLAGEAALRAGAGKLQIATAASAAASLMMAVPESRVLGLPEDDQGVLLPAAGERVVAAAGAAATVLLGPGLIELDRVVALLESVVPRLDTPVVVDALATAYVTRHRGALRHLTGRCVVTANPSELSHLVGWEPERVTADQVAATRETAHRTGAVVLCGGTTKTVATPDGSGWTIRAGVPGLGVSGSGDVQAGIVAGLLARGCAPEQAAVWGAYVHGTTGERLASSVGPAGFLIRELLPQIPVALRQLG